MVEKVETPHLIPLVEKVPTDAGIGNEAIAGMAEEGNFESVSSMADFKEKAPDVYRAMMMGIGMKITDEMRKHQRRFREILRKNRDNR